MIYEISCLSTPADETAPFSHVFPGTERHLDLIMGLDLLLLFFSSLSSHLLGEPGLKLCESLGAVRDLVLFRLVHLGEAG